MIEKYQGMSKPDTLPPSGTGLSITRLCFFCNKPNSGRGGGNVPVRRNHAMKQFACATCKPLQLLKIGKAIVK